MSNNNIVIVGGGFAGTQIAAALEKELIKAKDTNHRILLIESKSHFYHCIAGPRAAVIDIDDRILIPYTNLFQNQSNKVIQATALQFEKDHILLDKSVPEFDGANRIPYKYLVLATGTAYSVPSKASSADYETTRRDLSVLRKNVKNANSILIVGGGPVGVELAGEIREVYKDKKITVVHDRENVLDSNSVSEKVRVKLLELMKKNNIDTIFNESVILPDQPNKYFYENKEPIATKSGKMIQGIDLVILAFGNRPQTAWLKNTQLGTDILNTNGYVKVKDTLQVDYPELDNVFVLGDAADLSETKMAFRIYSHVPVVAKNLIQLTIKHEKPTSQYKKGPDAMVITFGSKQGAGMLPFGNMVVGNWVTSMAKGGSLFIDGSWKMLNAKDPATSQSSSKTFSTLLATSVLIAAIGAAYYYKYQH